MSNHHAISMKTLCGASVQTFIHRASDDSLVCASPVTKNLMFDSGLNALANRTGFGNMFLTCKLGSNATSNSTASGAVTFTQSAFTLTANAPFFTAGMVGQLFKYGAGTGGVEVYITAFTSSTVVTVDTSYTVGSATVGTVWSVNQTQLGTYINLKSQVYTTSGSGCQTTVSGNVITLKRTFYFAPQGSAYSVNEIGYTGDNNYNGTCLGRIVLPSTDSVATANYYSVVITLTFTISPSTVVPFLNVGTNINTAGSGIYSFFDFLGVRPTDGGSASYQGYVNSALWAGSQLMDVSDSVKNTVAFLTSTFTLPTSTSSGLTTYSTGNPLYCDTGTFAQSGAVGNSVASGTFNLTTSGQTIYGFSVGHRASGFGDVFNTFQYLLTTPFVTPVGTFSGSLSLNAIFRRLLSN